jgi:hypothetical protein
MLTFCMSTLSGQNQIEKYNGVGEIKHQFARLHDDSKLILLHTKSVDS